MTPERRNRNICWHCKHWEKCFPYRYSNRPLEYMKKYKTNTDAWGDLVIYVAECEKFDPDKMSEYPMWEL